MIEIIQIISEIYTIKIKKNESILFHNSLVMKDLINYMKRRVDDDIQLYISKKNLSDFLKPK